MSRILFFYDTHSVATHFLLQHLVCVYFLDAEIENYLRDTIQFLLINTSLPH